MAVLLPVNVGLFAINLGDTSVANMTQPIQASIVASGDVSLRCWFSDGVAGFRQLSPDQKLASTAFALLASEVPDASITPAKLTFSAIPNFPMGIQVFTNSGTWVKPASVTKVHVKLWGAGGGTQLGSNSAGGGGGAYCEGITDVTGDVVVTVGKAGLLGSDWAGTAATDGSPSSFLGLVAGGGGAARSGTGGTGGIAAGAPITGVGENGGATSEGKAEGAPGAPPGLQAARAYPGAGGKDGMIIVYY